MRLIILLLFIPFVLNAQNVVSVSYHPVDLGVGLRYDRLFKETGVFVAGSYGNYRVSDLYVKDHWKAVVGGELKTENGYLCLGVSYSHYGARSKEIDDNVFYPLSFEVGGNVMLNKWVVGIRMDFLKGEGCVEIGIKF